MNSLTPYGAVTVTIDCRQKSATGASRPPLSSLHAGKEATPAQGEQVRLSSASQASRANQGSAVTATTQPNKTNPSSSRMPQQHTHFQHDASNKQ